MVKNGSVFLPSRPSRPSRPSSLSCLVILLTTAATSFAQPPHNSHKMPALARGACQERPVPLRQGIGIAHDAVSTKDPQAQAHHDQGPYLHSMRVEAARRFIRPCGSIRRSRWLTSAPATRRRAERAGDARAALSRVRRPAQPPTTAGISTPRAQMAAEDGGRRRSPRHRSRSTARSRRFPR